MKLNFLKQASFVAAPGLYLFYLRKSNVHAKDEGAHNNLDKQVDKIQLVQSANKINDLKSTRSPRTYLNQSKNEATGLLEAFRIVNNIPGVVCGVSYRGKHLWSIANGQADVETRTPLSNDSVMRIASISKPMTIFLLAKLLEEGKIDLDKPIYEYLQDKFPQKYFDNQKVDITLRQLVSHLGGIRHYKEEPGESFNKEFLLNKEFKSVYECLDLFKNDDLISRPGTKFSYSTHGYTLISAVIQSVLEKESKDAAFEKKLIELLRNELFMTSTYLDVNDQIIPNRAKYYYQKPKPDGKSTQLANVMEVNNSCKWGGGGLLSTVHDLLKFGNAMLYSYKTSNGILKQETVRLLWTPVEGTMENTIQDFHFKYGMGWSTNLDHKLIEPKYKGLDKTKLNDAVFHTGQAMGVVSILIVFPKEEICVAIMVNSYDLSGIVNLAINIAKSVNNNVQCQNDSITN